jgi:glyoxylase-like metal-dependent hydrolase (beta-lactamase superfamily II)
MARNHGRGSLRSLALSLTALFLLVAPLLAAPNERQVTKLAEGVYAIEHQFGNSGNTTVIIGDRQVFVVDSPNFPAFAREDIAQIRQWTDKPVAYLLNTHFHEDHNNGNRAYMNAFPALTIIAQENTKRDMDLILPGNIARHAAEYAARIAAYKQGKDTDGRALSDEEKKQVQEGLPRVEQNGADFKALVYQPPTLTFTDKLDIDIGNREVQVKHLGRGHTPGDTVVYLPKEKILAAGDLLVYPVPHVAFAGYPSEWVQTLHKMADLDVTTIVTGHGTVLHDKAYIYLVADLLQSAVDQVRARVSQLGHPAFYPVDQVKGAVDLTPFRARFAGDDKDLQAEFDNQTSHLVELVFKEESLR